MTLLSSSVSISRYRVNGMIREPVLDTVAKGLKDNTITEIDEGVAEKRSGWSSVENPFKPDFTGSSFVYGAYFIFSLRIDRKTLSSKVVQKYIALETNKRLAKTGREFLTAHEKQLLKDHVVNLLTLRVPAIPNVHDIIWDHAATTLWFFSNQKAANEELETLFIKSFQVPLIRLFPYTLGELTMELSDSQKDALTKLTPTAFVV